MTTTTTSGGNSSDDGDRRCDPLLDRIAAHAARNPSKVAASFFGPSAGEGHGGKVLRQLTYGQLQAETSALAERLLRPETGLAPGDRYVCLGCAPTENVSILFVCLFLFAVYVLISPSVFCFLELPAPYWCTRRRSTLWWRSWRASRPASWPYPRFLPTRTGAIRCGCFRESSPDAAPTSP